MTVDPHTEEIRARLAAATPGDWIAVTDNGRKTGIGLIGLKPDRGTGRAIAVFAAPTKYRNADARLCAHAPVDLAYLLDRNKALEDVAEIARRAVTQRHDEIAHSDAIPPYYRPDCGHHGDTRHTKRCVNPEFTSWRETGEAMESARVTVAELAAALDALDGDHA